MPRGRGQLVEAQLFSALGCTRGARIRDAGCGAGHVAVHLARKGGFRVEGIDLTPRHIAEANNTFEKARMQDQNRSNLVRTNSTSSV